MGVGGGGLEWQVGAALHELSITLRRDAADAEAAEAAAEPEGNGDGEEDGEEGPGGGGLLRLRMQRLVLRGQRAAREGAR